MATNAKLAKKAKEPTKEAIIVDDVTLDTTVPETTPEDDVLTPEDSDVTIDTTPKDGEGTPSPEESDEDVTPTILEDDDIILGDAEDEADEDEVVMTPEIMSRPITRKVKVCLTNDHSCSIGGVRYNFEAGKTYNVPENVKTILRQAGLLAAI